MGTERDGWDVTMVDWRFLGTDDGALEVSEFYATIPIVSMFLSEEDGMKVSQIPRAKEGTGVRRGHLIPATTLWSRM